MIRILLEIVLFILIARFIVNWVFPFVLALFAMSSGTTSKSNSAPKKPNGKIKVDYIPPKKDSKFTNEDGEFVDYVEVK